jgi:membrane-associated phospholipid phosphatase
LAGPEGSRSHLGALLLGYYTVDGRLHYAGRAGTGMTEKELKRLWGVLAPLKAANMRLAEPPPRDTRFGSRLKLSRVHLVRPTRGAFPSDEAAMKLLYLALRNIGVHWKPAIEWPTTIR